jgi:Ser/Thr protein kinase RdoA (MazF antagonist)
METRGYSRTRHDDYHSPLLLVEDLHDGNVLVDSDGQLHVIDPVIFVNQRQP